MMIIILLLYCINIDNVMSLPRNLTVRTVRIQERITCYKHSGIEMDRNQY